MYNAIMKKLPNLTYKELQQVQVAVALELDHRESHEPIAYKCPHCDFEGQYGDVYNHISAEHSNHYHDKISMIYAPMEIYP